MLALQTGGTGWLVRNRHFDITAYPMNGTVADRANDLQHEQSCNDTYSRVLLDVFQLSEEATIWKGGSTCSPKPLAAFAPAAGSCR